MAESRSLLRWLWLLIPLFGLLVYGSYLWWGPADIDSGQFLVFAREVARGGTPFLDFDPWYSPLIYYLYGWWMAAFGVSWEAGLALALLIHIWNLVWLFVGGRTVTKGIFFPAVASTLFSLLLCWPYHGSVVTLEPLMVATMLPVVVLLLRRNEEGALKAPVWGVVGLGVGLTLFTKQNGLFAVGAAGCLLVFRTLREFRPRELLRAVAFFAGGVLFPWLLFFGLSGASVSVWFQQSILTLFEYREQSSGQEMVAGYLYEIHKEWALFGLLCCLCIEVGRGASWFGRGLLLAVVVLLCVGGGAWFRNTYRIGVLTFFFVSVGTGQRMGWRFQVLAAFFFATVLTRYVQLFPHYFIISLPFLLLYGLEAWERLRTSKLAKRVTESWKEWTGESRAGGWLIRFLVVLPFLFGLGDTIGEGLVHFENRETATNPHRLQKRRARNLARWARRTNAERIRVVPKNPLLYLLSGTETPKADYQFKYSHKPELLDRGPYDLVYVDALIPPEDRAPWRKELKKRGYKKVWTNGRTEIWIGE